MAEGTNQADEIMVISDLKGSFLYGMHGCGYYKRAAHTNAYDALKYWQGQGVKVMEIDISKTKDNNFVALAHLMNKHYLNLIEISYPDNLADDTLTEEWFMKQKICAKTTGGMKPMNLNTIVHEMTINNDLFVMFDLWRMWEKQNTYDFAQKLKELLKKENLLKRCVLEVYNKDMLAGIRESEPDLPIIYCVHNDIREPQFDENVSPFILKKMGVEIISFPWSQTKYYPQEIEAYHKEGFTIFSLTRNNIGSKKLKKAGVNVNLVDILYTPTSVLPILYYQSLSGLQKIVDKIYILKNKLLTR